MQRFLSAAGLLAVALVGAAGCSAPFCSKGWRFECGSPSVVWTPALAQQTSGNLAAYPLGSTIPPVLTGTAATPGAVRLMPTTPALEAAPAPRALAPADTCTCEQILAALNAINARLAQIGAARLPKGPEEE